MINTDLKDARILIVDDQESNIALLEDVLRRYGYADLKSTTDPRKVLTLVDDFHAQAMLRIRQNFSGISTNADQHGYDLAQQVIAGDHIWVERGIV